MKLAVSKLLPILFITYSFNAVSQNYIDYSYGHLEPKIIYNQANYFDEATLSELKATKGLPTRMELIQIEEDLALVKNAARRQSFGISAIPTVAWMLIYPVLAGAIYGLSYGASYLWGYCQYLALGPARNIHFINPVGNMDAAIQARGINLWYPMIAFMIAAPALNTIMGDPKMADTLQHLWGIAPPTDALIKLEASYIGHKHLIPSELQTKAEEMLFSTRLGGTSASTTSSYLTTLIALQKAQTRSCPIKKSWPEISRAISKALSRYPKEVREEILNLAYTYYIDASDDSSLDRLVAFFLGAPGLGKSRAAKLVANAFGVPVTRVSLAGRTPKDLWGSESTPGVLAKELAALGCNSGIMIFEDIDSAIAGGGSQAQSLETSLLELFDTTQDTIWLPFLQTHARTSRIFMIGTGNTALTKKALADRVNLVEFPDFEKKIKEEIIFDEYLKTRMKDLKIDPSEFAQAMEDLKREIANDNSTSLRADHQIVRRALAKFGRERLENKTKTRSRDR